MVFKSIYYLIGVTLLSLGITFTLVSDLGAGGWDALVENLYKLTNIKIGTWVILVALFLLIIAAVLRKEFIDYKAFIISIIMGKLIDFFYYSVNLFLKFESFSGRLFILIVGMLLIGCGCAIMFATKFPKNHTESFVFSIVDTKNISYPKVKTTADVTALLIALGVGLKLNDFSNLGVGTIISSFFMGTIIHKIAPYAEKGMLLFIKE